LQRETLKPPGPPTGLWFFSNPQTLAKADLLGMITLPSLNRCRKYRPEANHPQTNGICERFHKNIPQEFLPGRVPTQAL
jgi:hypothetical protein